MRLAGKVKMWDQRLRHEVANVQVGTMTSDPTGGESNLRTPASLCTALCAPVPIERPAALVLKDDKG
jgi:hypothetical protein